MAEARISVDQEQFMCPVCLDLLKDPVTIPCGHSYCMSCITGCWNVNDPRGIYGCPQCRQIFTPRPVLGRNVVLAEMVEKLKTQLQTGFPGKPGDVECDICTKKKHKAVKSCLVCLNSYCATHFERHEKLNPGRRHKVIDATGRLQEMICHKHDKILEVFCRTDQQFVCLLCVMDEHKHHDTVSAAEEKTKMQGSLREFQRTFQQQIQQKETESKELREAVASQKRSAQAAVEEMEKVFTELICSIEKSRSEATQLIRDQERASSSRAEAELQRLKQEIEDLRRRDAELEKISHTDHYIQMLQTLQSLSLTGSPKLFRSTVISDLYFNDVGKSVSKLTEQIKHYSRELLENITDAVKHIQISVSSEYETREKYLKYFHRFTLDPNTAHKSLHLSNRNRAITFSKSEQSYPNHPDRFDSWVQVLCTDSVSRRCYWEVDWDQGKCLGVSVSYKSISRKGGGSECQFGYNNQSWLLLCSPPKYIFLHNSMKTKFSGVSSCSRIGVYVDPSTGILSFYSVSDTMILLHKVQTTFTQPLYPGFTTGRNVSMKLCDVNEKDI